MSKLYIYDSLSQQKKLFEPIEPNKVRMYVCGATVYDFCHIGNARTWTAFDVIYRYLQSQGYEVQYVRNVTDIDDKIIQRAAENNEEPIALANRYTDILQADFKKLGLLPPTAEPRATEWVAQMIQMIQQIIDNECAYVTHTGDVYYAVKNYSAYGELSHQTLSELQHGIRVEVVESKHSPLDFVLWKAAKPGEPAWDSPWGRGRPGWHIECSAMSTALLGERIDIHGGGYDLTFPHHENERAQTEAVTHKPFVNYWMHAGFLNINQEKMSKSLNNFFKLRDVLNQYDPEVVRFFLLASHYRSQVNYSDESLLHARGALKRLYTALRDIDIPASAKPDRDFIVPFEAAMNDDFNTPEAVAVLFDLAKEINKHKESSPDKTIRLALTLKQLGGILGLLTREPEAFFQKVGDNETAEIERLIAARNEARARKDWNTADKVREQLAARHIVLEDAQGKTTWKKMM